MMPPDSFRGGRRRRPSSGSCGSPVVPWPRTRWRSLGLPRLAKNRSAAFAETLVSHIEGRSNLLRRSHRDAGFMVLLAPEVPAVLLEMGFVSNPEDEAMLRDPAQRGRVMEAVEKRLATKGTHE